MAGRTRAEPAIRVGVVVPSLADPWRDDVVVGRRVSGTLAGFADVDLLVGRDSHVRVRPGSAVRVCSFPAAAERPERRAALQRCTGWPPEPATSFAAEPPLAAVGFREDVPAVLETELVRAQSGYSPALFEHLGSVPYDVVVFVGALSASTLLGIECLPAGRRVALIPLLGSQPPPLLRRHRAVFERADAIVCLSPGEAEVLARMVTPETAMRITMVGFPFSVDQAVTKFADPLPAAKAVLLVGDWLDRPPPAPLCRQLELVARELPDLSFRIAGRGAERLATHPGHDAVGAETRIDLWRLISKATIVVDPHHRQSLGIDVSAALAFGVPVVVSASGGATRSIAEASGGGVWFRSYLELREGLRCLTADGTRRQLGTLGRAWAERALGDAEGFSERLFETVAGRAPARGRLAAP